MKRPLTLMAAPLVVGLLVSSVAFGSSRPTVQLRKTSLGTILVNSRGFTLYAFTRDSRNRDTCQSIRGCLGAWPVLSTSSRPVAGRGVKSSLLGTIKLKSGGQQVTYNGWPLYTYAGDSSPGQTSYVNIDQFGGRWPALNASGQEVK